MVTACSPEGEHAPLPSEPDAITLAPGTPSVKEFPAMGGLWELRFSATKAWSVVPADPVHAEWYRIEPAEGDDGNGTVKVTVLPNITTEKRSAEIIIRSGRAEQRLSFVQHASDMEPCGEEEVRRFLENFIRIPAVTIGASRKTGARTNLCPNGDLLSNTKTGNSR